MGLNILILYKGLFEFKYSYPILIITAWDDKIVDLEKTTWFYFRLMKTGFFLHLSSYFRVS